MAFEFVGRGLCIPKDLVEELGVDIIGQITEATGETPKQSSGAGTTSPSETEDT